MKAEVCSHFAVVVLFCSTLAAFGSLASGVLASSSVPVSVVQIRGRSLPDVTPLLSGLNNRKRWFDVSRALEYVFRLLLVSSPKGLKYTSPVVSHYKTMRQTDN